MRFSPRALHDRAPRAPIVKGQRDRERLRLLLVRRQRATLTTATTMTTITTATAMEKAEAEVEEKEEDALGDGKSFRAPSYRTCRRVLGSDISREPDIRVLRGESPPRIATEGQRET